MLVLNISSDGLVSLLIGSIYIVSASAVPICFDNSIVGFFRISFNGRQLISL